MPILIPLGLIEDSPYQTRQSYDEAYVKELSADIDRNGLMQVPVGRIVDAEGHVAEIDDFFLQSRATLNEYWQEHLDHRIQLAFGHNRLRALKRLDWAEMPVELKRLTDEEMARQAWAENAARKDLTPTEEALAIQRRMEAFGWTQKQVAEELGIGRSTVANKLRLLGLPPAVLGPLRAGEVSERQALAMLPVAQMTDEEREAAAQEDCYWSYSVDELVERATEKGYSSERIRKDALESVERAQKYVEKQREREEAIAKAKENDEELPKLSDLGYDQYAGVSDDPEDYRYVEGCSPACECRAEAIGYSEEVKPVCLDPGHRRSLKGQATKRRKRRRREEIQVQLEAFHQLVGEQNADGSISTSWSPAAVRVVIEEALRHASVKDLRPAAEHLGIDAAAAEIGSYDTRDEARAALEQLSMSGALRFVLETLVREDLRGYVENGFDTDACDAVMAGEPYSDEDGLAPDDRPVEAPLRLHAGADGSSPNDRSVEKQRGIERSLGASTANGQISRGSPLHCDGHLYEAWQARCAGCGATLPLGVGSREQAAARLEEKHWAREPDEDGDLRWMCSACNELEYDWTQNMKAI